MIADLLDDGINGEYEMNDADGNSVGTVNVNINFESGDGELLCLLFFFLLLICQTVTYCKRLPPSFLLYQ